MKKQLERIFADAIVVQGLRQSWLDSKPGFMGGHEEGGFVTENALGSLVIHRWPTGSARRILPPTHPEGIFQNEIILVSFHTHPHVGPDFQQEPSDTDMLVIANDPDLKVATYVGELVISQKEVYLVDQRGDYSVVGPTSILLQLS